MTALENLPFIFLLSVIVIVLVVVEADVVILFCVL